MARSAPTAPSLPPSCLASILISPPPPPPAEGLAPEGVLILEQGVLQELCAPLALALLQQQCVKQGVAVPEGGAEQSATFGRNRQALQDAGLSAG